MSVSMNCQGSLSPEGRSPEGERLAWQFMETHTGVNHSLVQWSSLALKEPPSWSWLTFRPGKYASFLGLQNYSDAVFLTPHLSTADFSPVLSMKRKLWNILMENQSFHEQWLLETARNIVLQSDSDHLLQEIGFNATNTPPVGCEWHYAITLILMCQSDSQLWPLHIPEVQQRWAKLEIH